MLWPSGMLWRPEEPATHLPTGFPTPKFSITLPSAHIPSTLLLQSLAADNMCHLFVLGPLWYPPLSALVTPSLHFTVVKHWFSPDPLLSSLKCLWCLLSFILSFFFFLRCPSVVPQPCQIHLVFNISSTSCHPWNQTTNQKCTKLMIPCGGKMGSVQTCDLYKLLLPVNLQLLCHFFSRFLNISGIKHKQRKRKRLNLKKWDHTGIGLRH